MAPEQKPELLAGIMPFFIVDSLEATISFYVGHLGFHTEMSLPESEPFFAILRRDSVSLMVKEIGPDTRPQPNHTLHSWAPWDAYVHTPNPDILFAEYQEKGVHFHKPIGDTEDGLRAFEIMDDSGYVLCFGRPN